MSVFKNAFRFYIHAFLAVTLVNTLVVLIFGAYFEDYEGIFSAIIQGSYSKPGDIWFETTNYFLILYIPEWLLPYVKPYNIYGILLLIYDLSCLTFAGLVIFRILRVNLSNKNWLIFFLLYLVICIDNIIQLNCTRHALILLIAVFGFIESRRMEGKPFSKSSLVFISLLFLLGTLFRFEAALLLSLFYILILIIFKRYYGNALIPLAISVFFVLLFHALVNQYSGEPVKVFTYKELEVTSRNNFDTTRLSEIQKLEVEAIRDYFITDKEHYTLAFYDSVAKYQPMTIFGAVNFNTFINNLKVSYSESIQSMIYLLFYLISGLLVWVKGNPRRAYKWYFTVFLAIPFLLAFYTVVPSRFIDPYFGCMGCLNVFYLMKRAAMRTLLNPLCIFFVFLLLLKGYWAGRSYRADEYNYKMAMSKLEALQMKYHKTVFINNFYTDKYFPVSPFTLLPQSNVRFLNFYLFNSWDFQREDWKQICNCNSFSLLEKINFIVASRSVFIVDDFSYEFLKRYLKTKYNVDIAREDMGKFNEYLTVCHLVYTE